MKNSYLLERFRELKSDFQKQINIADVWDRLAAFVLDFVLLILVADLFFAPIKKKLEIAVLNEHDGAAQIYFTMMIVGFCVLFVLYHSLCVSFFKKTIGKKVFALEVKSSLTDVNLSFGNCILRSFIQLLSLSLLGLPFLAIFSHKMRRPIHDRISDSVVCSLRKKGKTPDFIEKLWVRVVYATVMINVVIVTIACLYFFKNGMTDIAEFVTEPDYECDDVSDAKENWPDLAVYGRTSESPKKMTRLDIALTLFGAGEINKDCLEVEADKFLSFEQDLDEAYLAKAFTHEDQAQISNDYLKKVCEVGKDSESCVLTKMIAAWSDKKWDKVDLLLKDQKNWSPFFMVWAIQHYYREQNYKKVLELTEALSPNRPLADFLGRYKTIALWNLDRKDEAEQLFETSFAEMAKKSQDNFLSEMCRLEAEDGCSNAQAKACQWLKNEMQSGDLEYHPMALLSLVKSEKCRVTKVDDIIERYRNAMDDSRMQLFLAANKAEVVGKRAVASQIYENLLEATEGDPYFTYEVHSHLLDLASNKKDFESAVTWWLGTETFNNYHFAFGEKVLKELMNQRMWDLALKVSRKMMDKNYISENLQKQLAVVFYKNKKFDLAKSMIQKINAIEKNNNEKRDLASVDEYQEAKTALKGGK